MRTHPAGRGFGTTETHVDERFGLLSPAEETSELSVIGPQSTVARRALLFTRLPPSSRSLCALRSASTIQQSALASASCLVPYQAPSIEEPVRTDPNRRLVFRQEPRPKKAEDVAEDEHSTWFKNTGADYYRPGSLSYCGEHLSTQLKMKCLRGVPANLLASARCNLRNDPRSPKTHLNSRNLFRNCL